MPETDLSTILKDPVPDILYHCAQNVRTDMRPAVIKNCAVRSGLRESLKHLFIPSGNILYQRV